MCTCIYILIINNSNKICATKHVFLGRSIRVVAAEIVKSAIDAVTLGMHAGVQRPSTEQAIASHLSRFGVK